LIEYRNEYRNKPISIVTKKKLITKIDDKN